MNKIIKPKEYLKGEIKLPGDKSISHRVALIGGICKGTMMGKNFLEAEDCLYTVSAFRAMGIDIKIKNKTIEVHGKGLNGLQKPKKKLYLGNSGTTMRVLPGILAGQNFEVTLTGDDSLTRRPMERIIEPLRKMGVDINSEEDNGMPPLIIKGGSLTPITYTGKIASAQVKSCILFAGLYAKGRTSVTEPFISRDHTERLLRACGAKIPNVGNTVSIEGVGALGGKVISIPGDISSAAFFIGGTCILKGSAITIKGVGLNPTRMGFVNALVKMGANVKIKNRIDEIEPYGDIEVRHSELKGITVEASDVPLLIDEVPILAVVASQAEGETIVKGTRELRVKETDRVESMSENLRKMGVDIAQKSDSLIIKGNKKRFKKASLESFKDHRTAMAMAVASLNADGECLISDIDCVSTSFPEFFHALEHLAK